MFYRPHQIYIIHNNCGIIMRIKRSIYLVLYIYFFQILLLPLAHYKYDINEKIQCLDCRIGVQMNSSCGSQNTPCENPVHHHHNGHKVHDPAHCVVCKTFLQDVDNLSIDQKGFSQDFYALHCCVRYYSSFLLDASFSNRSPPLHIS